MSEGAHPDPVGRKAPDADLGAELQAGDVAISGVEAINRVWTVYQWMLSCEKEARENKDEAWHRDVCAVIAHFQGALGIVPHDGTGLPAIPGMARTFQARGDGPPIHAPLSAVVPEGRGAVPPGGDDLRALHKLVAAWRAKAKACGRILRDERLSFAWADAAAELDRALAGIQRGRPTTNEGGELVLGNVEWACGHSPPHTALGDCIFASSNARVVTLPPSAVGIVEGQATDGGQG